MPPRPASSRGVLQCGINHRVQRASIVCQGGSRETRDGRNQGHRTKVLVLACPSWTPAVREAPASSQNGVGVARTSGRRDVRRGNGTLSWSSGFASGQETH
jgi:hypothetical protein